MPLTKHLSSDARNTTVFAISSGVPVRTKDVTVLHVGGDEIPDLLGYPVNQMLRFNERQFLFVESANDISCPAGKKRSLLGSALTPNVGHCIRDVVNKNRRGGAALPEEIV